MVYWTTMHDQSYNLPENNRAAAIENGFER